MPAKAVDIKVEGCDVYIGRGSKWGNPFKMQSYTLAERDRVCDEYERWFYTTNLPSQIGELVGKKLGCYCKPLRCHGDFLARLANEFERSNLHD